MTLSPGVRLIGIKPELVVAFVITNDVYKRFGINASVLSVVDGDHDGGPLSTSSHYGGFAFDVDCPANFEDKDSLVMNLEASLGEEFHVLAHKTKSHIHVAYIPRRP